MDPSLYHAIYEAEERHWWFVGRRAILDALLARALARRAPVAHPEPSPPRAWHRRLRRPGRSGGRRTPRGLRGRPAAACPRRGLRTGGMLPLLSRYGQVTGLDSEPLALDYCRRRGFHDVHLQADFEARPVFDLVTLFDVLEHVDDEPGFLAHAARCLKPGGRLAVTVPAFRFLWSGHDDLNQHRRRYTRRCLVDLLERCGFEVERSSYFNTLLFPAAMFRPLFRRGGPGRGGARFPETAPFRRRPRAGRRPGPGGRAPRGPCREEILRPLRTGLLDAPLARSSVRSASPEGIRPALRGVALRGGPVAGRRADRGRGIRRGPGPRRHSGSRGAGGRP